MATRPIRELCWPLLGSWTGMEEQSASPWAPAATTRAMITFKLAVSDSVVVQDYRQVRPDGSEFTGHGVFLCEPDSEQVLWWLFDSYARPPVPATGGWIGAALTLAKTTPRGHTEHRFTLEGERLDYRVDTRLTEAPDLAPFLRGSYGRVSGH